MVGFGYLKNPSSEELHMCLSLHRQFLEAMLSVGSWHCPMWDTNNVLDTSYDEKDVQFMFWVICMMYNHVLIFLLLVRWMQLAATCLSYLGIRESISWCQYFWFYICADFLDGSFPCLLLLRNCFLSSFARWLLGRGVYVSKGERVAMTARMELCHFLLCFGRDTGTKCNHSHCFGWFNNLAYFNLGSVIFSRTNLCCLYNPWPLWL